MPSRSDEKTANDLLGALEQRLDARETVEKSEIANMLQYLLNFQFSSACAQSRKLTELRLRADIQTLNTGGKTNFHIEKREYLGSTREYVSLQVRVVQNRFAISRVYGKTLKVSWLFNEYGRLAAIDGIVLKSREERNPRLLEIQKYDERNDDWLQTAIHPHPLPPQVSLINKNFSRLESFGQYQSLCRFGHNTAQTVIDMITHGEVYDFPFPLHPEFQLSMEMMVFDGAAMTMCRSAGKLMPRLEKTASHYFMIKY